MEQTIEALKNFLLENIMEPGTDLQPDSSLRNLGVDSFSMVELVLFIERRFGLVIPDHLMIPETFESLRSLAKTVEDLKNA